jgi:uncharacterized protein
MKRQDLPSILPLYAANGTVLLPRAQLPLLLHSTEEKELIDFAFKNGNRLIGVIQANPEGGHFQKGCIGRILNFQDGIQLFITLGGICRFQIEDVLEECPIKMAKVSYKEYETDLDERPLDPLVDRPRLLSLLRNYLDDQQITTNWEEINHASDELIISSLTMVCPFKPIEKQALLEMTTLAERCHMMIALMEMASPHLKGQSPILH